MLHHAAPTLTSTNLDETADFYGGKLGFEVQFRAPDYLVARRDSVELHFRKAAPRVPGVEVPSCFIRVADADQLFREFSGRGVTVDPPEVRPWEMKELSLLDPHGNLLRFGEDLGEE